MRAAGVPSQTGFDPPLLVGRRWGGQLELPPTHTQENKNISPQETFRKEGWKDELTGINLGPVYKAAFHALKNAPPLYLFFFQVL